MGERLCSKKWFRFKGEGTQDDRFLTINKAASVAVAGNTVIVHEGEYREWVKPVNAGLSNKRRVYISGCRGSKSSH